MLFLVRHQYETSVPPNNRPTAHNHALNLAPALPLSMPSPLPMKMDPVFMSFFPMVTAAITGKSMLQLITILIPGLEFFNQTLTQFT